MLLITAFIWGSSFVAQSKGLDYVGPFTFNTVKNIIGGFFLIPIIMVIDKIKMKNQLTDQQFKEEKVMNKTLIIGGILCGIALYAGCSLQQFGLLYTTAGKSGFITALYIVIVPLLGIFFKNRITLKVWISVVVAIFGFYLLCITENFNINKGDIITLICALFFSIHILLIDYFAPRVDGVRMSCIQFFICGIISFFSMIIFEEPSISSILSAWLPLAYAGFLSCGVAYTLQVIAQKDTEPVIASLIMSLEAVFAALSGWLILHEVLSVQEFIGCILVFVAIVITQLPSKHEKTLDL